MKSYRRANILSFIIVFALIIAVTFLAFFGAYNYHGDLKNTYFKGSEEIRWGLDISGGVEAIFVPDVENPGRLANLHYFNPALVMELVEVVKGEHTSEQTAQELMEFCKASGKHGVLLRKEVEKFIVNRIISAIANEAYWLVENGYCSVEDVDIACKKGAGHKMGPFESKDLTGIDRNFLMMQAQYDKTGVKPVGYDLFKEKYDQGRFGRKTGHGFYDYE